MMRALVSARYAFTVVRKPLRRVAGTGPTAVLTRWHLAVVDGTASVTTRVSYTLSSRKSAPPRPRPLAGGATRSVRCPPRHGRMTTSREDRGPVFVTGGEGIQRRPGWTRIDAGPSGLESIPWEHRAGIPRRSRKARFVTATDVSSTQPASESAEEIEALTTPHRPDDWSDLDQTGRGHHPGPRRGRRAEGRQRPPGHRDVARAARLRSCSSASCVHDPSGPGLGRPRPLRPLLRALEPDAVPAAVPRRLRPGDRGPRGAAHLGLADAGPPRVRPHPGRRDHHRPAGPGPRLRGRDGDGRPPRARSVRPRRRAPARARSTTTSS